MRHSKGYRNRGRKLLRKHPREKGLRGLGRLLIKYSIGDLVHIDISPDAISTAPHRRYQGRVGRIIEKRGRAFVIEVPINNKKKYIITTKEHIKPVKLVS